MACIYVNAADIIKSTILVENWMNIKKVMSKNVLGMSMQLMQIAMIIFTHTCMCEICKTC